MAHPRSSSISAVVLAVALAAAATPAHADPAPADAVSYAAAIVSDAALDTMRGGFELPNGMDISIGIEVDTLVNGSTVLRTLLTGSDGSTLQVFAGGPTVVSTDPGNAGKGLTVHVGSTAATDGSASNGQLVQLTPNGASVVTESGTIHLVQSNGQSTVLLDGNGLALQHMIGALTGAIVANQGSDRTIDTNVTVNLNIQNSAIPIGSMLMRLDNVLAGAGARGTM